MFLKMSPYISFSLLALLATIAGVSTAGAETITGTVTRVSGGVLSVQVGPEKWIRGSLYGIYYVALSADDTYLTSLTEGKAATLNVIETPAPHSKNSIITVNGININEALLKSGLAVVSAKYCQADVCAKWRGLELEAKNKKIGRWKDPKFPKKRERLEQGGTGKNLFPPKNAKPGWPSCSNRPWKNMGNRQHAIKILIGYSEVL